MKSKLMTKLLAITTSVALAATPALARNASQMTDLVGARGDTGESKLEARGFTFITSIEGDYNTYHSYWWNSRDKNCLHVELYKGQFTAITDAKNSDCNRSDGSRSNSDAAVAAGVVAGAAILGALLSHKSHHKEGKNYNESQTGDFERGYSDGLHAASYHNYDRSDAYAHGYEQGTEQRNINLRHHSRRGGHASSDYIRGPGGLEEKCHRAVARETGARVIGTNRIEESQAATGIYVNVQGAQAPWLCLGYRDGTIGEIRYSGREG